MGPDSENRSFAISKDVCFSIPYTIIKKGGNSNSSLEWSILDEESRVLQVKNIVLKQNPSEVLDLQIKFEPTNHSQDYYQHLYKVTYMKIVFQNYLHEFDTDYIYEFIFKQSCSSNPDQTLFSFSRQRFEKEVVEEETYFSSYFILDTDNLYICIRRVHKNYQLNTKYYLDYYTILKEEPTDIKLVVGTSTFYAHKIVLEHYSEVLQTMLKTRAKTDVLHIYVFKPEVIREMIHFLYTGRIEYVKMRYELLKVAYAYKLHNLYQQCIECIFLFSDCKNIARTLEVANTYDKSLKERALTFIRNHKEEMNKEPSYLN